MKCDNPADSSRGTHSDIDSVKDNFIGPIFGSFLEFHSRFGRFEIDRENSFSVSQTGFIR